MFISVVQLCLMDEAHKYFGRSKGSSKLTETLLSVIRQQRHIGIRVVLSTQVSLNFLPFPFFAQLTDLLFSQEPNVISHSVLALASIIILHRFSSADWWEYLKKHLGVETKDAAFEKILTLRVSFRFSLPALLLFTEFDPFCSTIRR